MRGLGEFQQSQMRRGDPRIPEMFRYARSLLDVLEQVTLYPHQPSAHEAMEPKVSVVPTSLETAKKLEKIAHTVKEVSQLLGVGRSSIWKSISMGELRAVKFGSRTLVLDVDLQFWVTSWPSVRSKQNSA